MTNKIFLYLEWLCLLSALGAFTITEQYRAYVTFGLGLLAAAFVLRFLRTRCLVPRTRLELPILLFLFSAGLSTWIAFERGTALLQMVRILAAIVLFYAVIQSNQRVQAWIGGGFVLMAAFLAIYWPLQHDFSTGLDKVEVVGQIGRWLTTHFSALPGPSIHANVGAGTLALALPFAVVLTWEAASRSIPLSLVAGLLVLLIAFSLFLTASRGAWIGVLGMLGLVALVLVERRWFSGRRVWFWFGVVLAGTLLVVGLVLSGRLERLLGTLPDPTGALQSRPRLWEQGLLLIGDYPFTGSGLMTFRMVYAVYGLLIHVPFHDHLHNTYLEIWLEQGGFGVLALILGMGVILKWAWRSLKSGGGSVWGAAGMAALAVVAIHSIFDVVFYVTRTLPLIGLVTGFAFLAVPQPLNESQDGTKRSVAWFLPSLFVLCGLMGLAFYRPLLSAFYTNLGALAQTRAELTVYDAEPYDDPSLDEVRRQVDLTVAELAFRQALRWNASNRTALQRLAEIALSRGEYEQALAWMQSAWQAGHRDQITRLLLGDALIANGEIQAAAKMVYGLSWAVDRLQFQAWYRYYLVGDYARAALAWETVLLLDPTNAGAQRGLELARQQMRP